RAGRKQPMPALQAALAVLADHEQLARADQGALAGDLGDPVVLQVPAHALLVRGHYLLLPRRDRREIELDPGRRDAKLLRAPHAIQQPGALEEDLGRDAARVQAGPAQSGSLDD